MNLMNDELLGLAELAELYRVTKATASNWSRRHTFPDPVAHLKMGPVWHKSDVVEWRTPAAQQTWTLGCGSCASRAVVPAGFKDQEIKLYCFGCDKTTTLVLSSAGATGAILTVKEDL